MWTWIKSFFSALFGSKGPQLDPAAVADVVRASCNFLPTVESVAAILTANPAIATASAVANIICAAIPKQPAAVALVDTGEVSFPVTVNGQTVIVSGTKVSQ